MNEIFMESEIISMEWDNFMERSMNLYDIESTYFTEEESVKKENPIKKLIRRIVQWFKDRIKNFREKRKKSKVDEFVEDYPEEEVNSEEFESLFNFAEDLLKELDETTSTIENLEKELSDKEYKDFKNAQATLNSYVKQYENQISSLKNKNKITVSELNKKISELENLNESLQKQIERMERNYDYQYSKNEAINDTLYLYQKVGKYTDITMNELFDTIMHHSKREILKTNKVLSDVNDYDRYMWSIDRSKRIAENESNALHGRKKDSSATRHQNSYRNGPNYYTYNKKEEEKKRKMYGGFDITAWDRGNNLAYNMKNAKELRDGDSIKNHAKLDKNKNLIQQQK